MMTACSSSSMYMVNRRKWSWRASQPARLPAISRHPMYFLSNSSCLTIILCIPCPMPPTPPQKATLTTGSDGRSLARRHALESRKEETNQNRVLTSQYRIRCNSEMGFYRDSIHNTDSLGVRDERAYRRERPMILWMKEKLTATLIATVAVATVAVAGAVWAAADYNPLSPYRSEG